MKKTNLLLLAVAIFALPLAIMSFKSEAPMKASYGESFMPIWNSSKAMAIAVAKAMPEDKYNYKPSDVSKTFGTQMVHIAYSASWVADMYLNGTKKPWEEPDASKMTKDEIIAMIEKEFGDAAEIIKNTKDWETEITSFAGNQMSKMQAINGVLDHITNHRAKANLYIRMNGEEPPKYGYY